MITVENLQEILLGKIKILSETTWESKANQVSVNRWLENFSGEKEKIHLLYLLSQFMYFGGIQIKELLKGLYRDLYRYRIIEQIRKLNGNTTDFDFIESKFREIENKTLFLGMGNPSESGTHLLYFFRQENKLSKQRFINAFEIFDRTDPGKDKLRFPDISHFVFIDDFCGSGTQANLYSREIVDRIKSIDSNIHTSYLMLFSTTEGKNTVKTSTNFDYVEALVELDNSFKCFHSDSRYFGNYSDIIDKDFAKLISESYGFSLFKSIYEFEGIGEPLLSNKANKHKLGYNDCQLLIGFFHNTPDNTLPTIWYDEQHISWYPIFKRYNKIY